MDDNKVVRLSDFSNNALRISVKDLLELALEECESENSPLQTSNRAILIFLDTHNQNYNIHTRCANISCSQVIAALRIAEAQMMQEMGFI